MMEGNEIRNRKLVNSIMEGGRGDGELAEGYDGKKLEDLRWRIGRRVCQEKIEDLRRRIGRRV